MTERAVEIDVRPDTSGMFQVGATDAQKLDTLAHDYGFDGPIEMLEEYVTDSLCPGICMHPACSYSTEVEPDCEAGWCEECDAGTVKSGMILAGVI